ncbi:hypothetical protein GSI_03816 [Ganoderma sinense ZZ0214-1]|uniref:Uncharacterized protein n=1 Tax=Ganoderma sinense ZZ0214-1 TaxID=1077348 RepID=A0A2G8SK05_9APHY|nr:hypothetical protein GSI_03816 [Ganoderma sinense ZZ0214-1]
MIPERVQRTVLVETVFNPDDLRTAFSQCGVIRGIYAAGCAGDVPLFRYYVEYRDPEAVGYACTLQLGGTVVYTLDYPGLVNDFLSVAQPDLFRKPTPDALNSMARSGCSTTPHKARNAQAGKAKSRPSTYTIIDPATPTNQGQPSMPHLRLPTRPDPPTPENDNYCPSASSRLPSVANPVLPVNDSSPLSAAYMQSRGAVLPPRPPSYSGTSSSQSAVAPRGLLDAQVSDALPLTHGQPHGLQLDRLGLEEVIAALKATANGIDGRAKWFTAGSDYYRSKDFAAAIAVLTAMIEVMLGNGLKECDLRPAILLLADSYRHLARTLGSNTNDLEALEDSKLLYAQSIELLRKVFGSSGIPSMFRDSILASTPTSNHTGGVPLGPFQSVNTLVPGDMRMAPTTASFGPCATPNRTPPASPAHGQVKILQREVESLRDRHRHQQDALSRERSAKRKLEDSLDSERHRRRRLEEDLKQASKSAVCARRGEEYALDQCRVEHESRRRAEGEVEELRGYIAAMEPMLERGEENEKKTKEYLRKVAISLMKAADGNLAAALPTLAKT